MSTCVCVCERELLHPQILETRPSSRTCHVAEETLRQISYGLLSNEGLSPQALLVFVHGLVSDAIPRLSDKPRPSVIAMATHSSGPRKPEDSRLIAKEPGRARPKPKSQKNAAAHVITEFGLQVCTLSKLRVARFWQAHVAAGFNFAYANIKNCPQKSSVVFCICTVWSMWYGIWVYDTLCDRFCVQPSKGASLTVLPLSSCKCWTPSSHSSHSHSPPGTPRSSHTHFTPFSLSCVSLSPPSLPASIVWWLHCSLC